MATAIDRVYAIIFVLEKDNEDGTPNLPALKKLAGVLRQALENKVK